MIIEIVIGAVVGFAAGWFANSWKQRGAVAGYAHATGLNASAEYEVRLTRMAAGQSYSRTIYTGPDLQEAKTIYKTAEGPARTEVHLYTRGNHTATRAI